MACQNTSENYPTYIFCCLIKHKEPYRTFHIGSSVGLITGVALVQFALPTATSVQHRVVILNAIVLPSVLFTSAVFDMPRWEHTELAQLYKRFLSHHASEAEVYRHKINPALLFTPKQAGGVGLVSFEVDLKSQRTKLALRYILQ